MIDNDAWKDILATATDFTTVCEIYGADTVPTAGGFDPNDAIDCFAAIAGITYFGVEYKRLVKKFGNINRNLGSESNRASVEFSNLSNVISQFEFANGFEGLIKVIRLISRGQSTTLALSQILFTGRCEKPTSGDKTSLSVTSTWILGGLEVTIPRRKYTKEDQEGRVSTDPEFEGFLFIKQYGTSGYSVRVKRGGWLGLFGLKKTVQKTLAWSSFSDIDANKSVPEVFGRTQLLGTHIGYEDIGVNILMRTAFCEGEILDFQNARSVDPSFSLSATSYAEYLGKVGILNASNPGWVAPGNYSRTAHLECQANNSAADVVDSAPDVAAVIMGRLMTIPNSSGAWVTTGQWSDNAAAHTYFILTSPDYFKLDGNWIEEPDFYESYLFNNEYIIDRSLTDFLFVTAG